MSDTRSPGTPPLPKFPWTNVATSLLCAVAGPLFAIYSPNTAPDGMLLRGVLMALHVLYAITLITAMLRFRIRSSFAITIAAIVSGLITFVDAAVVLANTDYFFDTPDYSPRLPASWGEAAAMSARAASLRTPLWAAAWAFAAFRSLAAYGTQTVTSPRECVSAPVVSQTQKSPDYRPAGGILAFMSMMFGGLIWSAKFYGNPLVLPAALTGFLFVIGIGLITLKIPENSRPTEEDRYKADGTQWRRWAIVLLVAATLGGINALAVGRL